MVPRRPADSEMICSSRPILVSRLSNQVIDGRHRLKAALLNGRKLSGPFLFDGDHGQAFILAVQTNIAHGLPLTLDDRRAAAVRIIRSNPNCRTGPSESLSASPRGRSARSDAVQLRRFRSRTLSFNPSSRATSATGRGPSNTIFTPSSLYSGENFRRFCGTLLLILRTRP